MNTTQNLAKVIVGLMSLALCEETQAQSYYTAGGGTVSGTSTGSVAIGSGALAIGDQIDGAATAVGYYARAGSPFSLALGAYAKTENGGTLAVGEFAHATGGLSVAVGPGTLASGHFSIAIGPWARAADWNAIAMGEWAEAGGMAVALNGTASGWQSVALNGYAEGFMSFAAGGGSALEASSIAIGEASVASGQGSVAMGVATIASGHHSAAFGNSTSAVAANCFVVGVLNDPETAAAAPLFIVGNGVNTPHNAFTVYQNGRIKMERQGDISMGDFAH